jgi:predicted nuclease of predicted toxin-antitoxin system
VQLILDENFPKAAVVALRKEGHDVLWIREFAPGTKGKDLLLLAAQQQRIVLTLDKDFQYLSFKPESGKYGVILFRVHPAVSDKIIPVVLKILSLEFDWFGNVSVVSESAVRSIPFQVTEQI